MRISPGQCNAHGAVQPRQPSRMDSWWLLGTCGQTASSWAFMECLAYPGPPHLGPPTSQDRAGRAQRPGHLGPSWDNCDMPLWPQSSWLCQPGPQLHFCFCPTCFLILPSTAVNPKGIPLETSCPLNLGSESPSQRTQFVTVSNLQGGEGCRHQDLKAGRGGGSNIIIFLFRK